jgi:hypothetical protein
VRLKCHSELAGPLKAIVGVGPKVNQRTSVLEENRTRSWIFPGVRLENDYAKSRERTDFRSITGALKSDPSSDSHPGR